MKQIKIEIILESDKFEESYIEKLTTSPEPQFFQDFIQSFTWAFQVADSENLVLRKLQITVPCEQEQLAPPVWIRDGVKQNIESNIKEITHEV